MKAAVQSVIRHVLTALSGYLVAKGFLDETLATEVVGLGVGLVGVGWGIYEKFSRR